jgi:2-succinyl-5-enolpyruvyl-6-hydroxy-3-cyclohexene-1-carboxylate synthase
LLFEETRAARRDGNRGTSGIEGATSTATGAALVSGELTVLVTGDLGFLYDSNALWCLPPAPTLRVVVILNGGGGIFRFLPGPGELPDARALFEAPHGVDVAALARLHGFEVFTARDEQGLREALPPFLAGREGRAAVLVVDTSGQSNATIWRDYFNELSMS